MDDGSPIESLRNLGAKSGFWLRSVGIETTGELKRLGPAIAFRLVKQRYPHVSHNLLWAMAAGLKGQDWRELDDQAKLKLLKDVETE